MKDISELDYTANLMRVQWTKAGNFYNSFARTFVETRAAFGRGEYGSEWSFGRWLVSKVGLTEPFVGKMLMVFHRVLAEEDRQKLAAQMREQARLKRLAAEQKKAAVKLQRAERAAERAAAEAERQARQAQRKADARRAKDRERARARAAAKKAALIAAAAAASLENADELTRLAARIKAAEGRLEAGRKAWIADSLDLATALAAARGKFPDNIGFAGWLKRHDISYRSNTLAALINMGLYVELTRTALQATERRSYRLIWEHEIAPQLPAPSDSNDAITPESIDEKAEQRPEVH